jgi:hypothetical protein
MSNDILSRLKARALAKPYQRHSDLYRWLRSRHRLLSGIFMAHQPSWETVAEEIAAAGLLGTRGNPPTAGSVRRVWQRVCRDIEAEAADTRSRKTCASAPPVPPSRVPAAWRPVPAVPKAPPLSPESQTVPSQTNQVAGARSRTAEEKLADLQRTLEERSGRRPRKEQS